MSKSIFITGASGFVGTNLIHKLDGLYSFRAYKRDETIAIQEDIVLHLAGKAHDLKKTSDPNEYYQANTVLTCKVFDAFLASDAKVFITLSSVKAIADKVAEELTEETPANPITHYGKSKLEAEKYILSKPIPANKKVYILRPCLIHGPGNKGNLNLLFKLAEKGIPWPLAAFENKRSFLSIDNLIFAIKSLIEREDIASGVYNIADDDALSTNELIILMGESIGKKPVLWKLSEKLITTIAKIGDTLHLPLNSERLNKLTESYVVSNKKLMGQLRSTLPITASKGLIHTFNSINENS